MADDMLIWRLREASKLKIAIANNRAIDPQRRRVRLFADAQLFDDALEALSALATPTEALVATHSELIRVYRHKAGGPARIVATANSWSGLGPGTDYEMVHEQTISWSEANAPALSASATSRPVSPARPPQVAELAAKARSVADGLIRIDGDRDWDTRSDISVETVTQEIVPLLRSLATALAAQGDGE